MKKMSRNYKFAANLNENLRDQLACGLSCDVIRQRLFEEDDSVMFAQSVKLASSLEAVQRDAAVVDVVCGKTLAGTNAMCEVHALTPGGGASRSYRAGGVG